MTAHAPVFFPLLHARAGLGAAARWIAAALGAERARWILWLPVALGAGIGVYFELPSEPTLLTALFVLALGAALWAFVHPYPFGIVVGAGAFAAALGFASAKLHTDWVQAPVIAERIGPLDLFGRVVEVEPTHRGMRAVLALQPVARLGAARTPAKVRLTFRDADGLTAGDEIRVRAILMPPPPPASPGAYDFQRQAYFQRIGGVGFALGEPEILRGAAGFAFGEWLERRRQRITERILAALPSPTGALAAAQITGHRHTIPPEVMIAMQNSGLAHLLAISGMNIGIVAGIVFFAVRALLALVPWLALRISTKKWAAVAALIVALIYVAISGASVPTQRAYLMLAVVMAGVLIDRETLSMRLVAWAAMAILLAAPDGLLGPSFQMSFAAVVALIACYERWVVRKPSADPPTLPLRAARLFGGLALTSLIAGLATAPFGMYSFHRVTVYGLAANLFAVPATDFVVMPCALVAMLAMPFGLEAWPLQAMGWGVDFVHLVARTVASWPGAVVSTAAMPGWGLLVFALGGLWLAIWQRRWRWCGVPVMVAGLASLLAVDPPDILVSADGGTMAVRAADGGLYIAAANLRAYTADTYQRRDGAGDARPWPRSGATADGRLRCDALGCLYAGYGTQTRRVAFIRDPAALAEDCAVAALIVAPALTRPACRDVPAIDRRRLMTRGSHAVWLDGPAPRIVDDRDTRGDRPWVSYPWPERNADRPVSERPDPPPERRPRQATRD